MIVELRNGKVFIRGIENRVLRNMAVDELAAELTRVDRDLAAWKRMVSEHPRRMRTIIPVRREHNVLQNERRRIDAELKRRYAMMLGTITPAIVEVAP